MPQPGQLYRHYKGGVYKVLHIGVMESDLTPVVIYQKHGDPDSIWVRSVCNFLEPVNGQPRFESVTNRGEC